MSIAVLELAVVHAARGDCAVALGLADRGRPLVEVEPEDQVARALRGWTLARCDCREEARSLVRDYEATASSGWVDPITLAALRASLGDMDEAIRLVERGIDERSPTVMSLEFDFMLDPLRGDPRFVAAVDRVRDGHAPRVCSAPALVRPHS